MASFEIFDQNHVVIGCAAGEGQLFAVWREGEREEAVAREVGQLYTIPAVERLGEDVGDAVLIINVGDGAAVECPAKRGIRYAGSDEGTGDYTIFLKVERIP